MKKNKKAFKPLEAKELIAVNGGVQSNSLDSQSIGCGDMGCGGIGCSIDIGYENAGGDSIRC
jgi:hypothetical protein